MIIDINKIMLVRRNTKQKNIVYDAVLELAGHVSADEVYEKVAETHPSISKATVYRNLNVLSEEGRIRRIEPNFMFEERHFDFRLTPHSHAICSKCGKIIDVYLDNEDSINSKIKTIEDGFELISHELIFKGICKECRENKEN